MEKSEPMASEAYAAYLKQAGKLSLETPTGLGERDESFAKKAEFITPNDAVVETTGKGRLPPIPVDEAEKLNELEARVHGDEESQYELADLSVPGADGSKERARKELTAQNSADSQDSSKSDGSEEPLGTSRPPRTTNPLFPPLPLYGPSSITRDLQCYTFRATSFVLSLLFLLFLFAGGLYTSIIRWIHGGKEQDRPYYEEEMRRQRIREAEDKSWEKRQRRSKSPTRLDDTEAEAAQDSYIPTEGGKDPVICDVAYYARRVGLDMEEYKVQTEDGFIIDLWHIYNPAEYTPKSASHRSHNGPNLLQPTSETSPPPIQKRKYPILLLHGLLQSSGAFCTNDNHSLAFYLCKSGYDVWLGNNRCGFTPEHTSLSYSDPRMWNWNIRQMGILDLPALISRVLHETQFPKLALVAHSQGTAQTLVALAKDQRPELGDKISVFCGLAPAAYAGPLLNRFYLKLFRKMSLAMYKIVFGIHAFIPTMLFMHKWLPSGFYGKMGYLVFSFLFNWSDTNWDRGLRDRMFRFAPVYVSSEGMRWWLGKGGFAKQKCILAEKGEWEMEDVELDVYDEWAIKNCHHLPNHLNSDFIPDTSDGDIKLEARKAKAWYDDHVPPMAFWVAGSDDLVDGRRLLRRFDPERGREPFVRVVHQKVIEHYEHLDLIWAVDCVEQVGREVRDVVWGTRCLSGIGEREVVVPVGCEGGVRSEGEGKV